MTESIDVSTIPEDQTIRHSPEDRLFAMQVLTAAIETMTERQVECLVLMLVGFSQGEIAHRLGLPELTIQEHLESAFAKIRAIANE